MGGDRDLKKIFLRLSLYFVEEMEERSFRIVNQKCTFPHPCLSLVEHQQRIFHGIKKNNTRLKIESVYILVKSKKQIAFATII